MGTVFFFDGDIHSFLSLSFPFKIEVREIGSGSAVINPKGMHLLNKLIFMSNQALLFFLVGTRPKIEDLNGQLA